MTRQEVEVGSAANSYEILAKLATGGMAEIFLARGASTAGVERYVVLKRILKHKANDAAFVRMFLDEARLAAQLQHHNIAQVYDIGKLGESYFFTMEYVHGETVRAVLQRSHALRSAIPIASVLVIGAGSAAGLHHAHVRIGLDGKPLGIVHRDVSPSNLMVSYEGGVKVVDFGVAKAAHRTQETRSGTVKGKISYLSPEQCRGLPIDRRSDLFSLGIVLWEMLTLERLYKRASDFEAMQAIVNEEVPPPSHFRPDVPPELDALVMRLLAKDPDRRYQSADELHEAFETIAVRLGTALSSAALARFLRDLFGQRPEPWVEMQSRETHPEAFTVTSEPIPADFGISDADELDLKLYAVPDLSMHRPVESESSEAQRPLLPGHPTTPLRVPSIALPTLAMPGRRGTAPPMIPLDLPPPAMMSATPTTPQVPTAMLSAAPTTAMAVPRPIDQSASHPALVGYGGSQSYQQAPERKVPRAVYILVGALAIGMVVGIAFALRGGTDKPAQHAGTPARAEAGPVAIDATLIATVGSAGTGSANEVPVVVDANVATAPIDAICDPFTNPHGCGDEPAAAKPDAGVKKPRKDPREPSPAEEVGKLVHDGKYADALTSCAGTPSLAAQATSACVLAACHTHDVTRARRWLANAGSKKASLTSACKAAGTVLDQPATFPQTPDCVTDPMACQH